jgi:hypothetical protein
MVVTTTILFLFYTKIPQNLAKTWQGFVMQSCGLASHAVCQIQEPVFYIVFFFRYFNGFLND